MTAGCERSLRGTLNRRTVGDGIRERHADFDHVRARARQRNKHIAGAIEIRITGGDVCHEARPLRGLERVKRLLDAAHAGLPAFAAASRAAVSCRTVSTSLSPRPERLSNTTVPD